MTVYQPLGDYLARLTADHANLTFDGIERILGRRLPPSARTRGEWWANNRTSPGRHCQVWLMAGWKVDSFNLQRETVSFARVRPVPKTPVGESGHRGHDIVIPKTASRLVAAPRLASAGEQLGAVITQTVSPAPEPLSEPAREWFWEGNVQSALIRFLVDEGWSIRRAADTAGHEHGVDVLAVRDGRLLAVEVKGYPPSFYTFGVRKGEMKPSATARGQAEKFFAQALHAAIRTRTRRPNAEIALAFPALYEALIEEAGWALSRIGVGVYLVTQDGKVRVALTY